MTGMMQIWPLSEVRARVDDDPSVDEIKIFPGHIDKPKGMVTMNLKRMPSGEWNNKQFDRLELHRGHYTAILSPSKEVIWMEGQNQFQDTQPEFNYMYPFQGQPQLPQHGNMDMMQLFKELTETKEKLRIMQQENEDLKEELKQFETASGKFEHAIGNVIMNVVLPMFSGQPQQQHNPRIQQQKNTSAMSMQGNQQEDQEIDFTQLPIRDQNDGGVQDAFNIIYHAFGDELVVKIAQRLQREPGLVNTLRAFIG